MFRVQNRVIRTRFSTLPAPVVPGPGKVVKIRPKHFSTILTENNKNCATNYVVMFRVQNWVILAWFSALPALVVLGLVKVVKIDENSFQEHWRQTIRTVPWIVWVCFWSKTGSSRPDYQLSQLWAYSGAARTRKVVKIWPKHFSTVLTEGIRIAPQKVWVCFGCKTESFGPIFQLCLLLWSSGLEKLSKSDRNIFQLYWPKKIRTAPQTIWVRFGSKTDSSWPGFQLYLL